MCGATPFLNDGVAVSTRTFRDFVADLAIAIQLAASFSSRRRGCGQGQSQLGRLTTPADQCSQESMPLR